MKSTLQQLEKLKTEIQQLEHHKNKLMNQHKIESRKIRTHRLIERGAILESLIPSADQLTNKQVLSILQQALSTAQMKEYIEVLHIKADQQNPLL